MPDNFFVVKSSFMETIKLFCNSFKVFDISNTRIDFVPELCLTDLLIRLEWDIPAHHVVEEDTEGPDGRSLPVVSTLLYPFGRSVHSGSSTNKIIKIY